MIDLESLVWVELDKPENFHIIRETLTRMGIASTKEKTLYQSCHILHKRGKYAIVHFKELFLLDGKSADFTDEDRRRRNTIAYNLQNYGLLQVIDQKKIADKVPASGLAVIKASEKKDYQLISKYTVGKKSNNDDNTSGNFQQNRYFAEPSN